MSGLWDQVEPGTQLLPAVSRRRTHRGSAGGPPSAGSPILLSGGFVRNRWTKDIPAPETAALVRAFVDATLAAPEGRPSPGPAAGAG